MKQFSNVIEILFQIRHSFQLEFYVRHLIFAIKQGHKTARAVRDVCAVYKESIITETMAEKLLPRFEERKSGPFQFDENQFHVR